LLEISLLGATVHSLTGVDWYGINSISISSHWCPPNFFFSF
jgi:hypothetical protein